MKKRVIAGILSLLLLMSFAPTAMAAGDAPQETSTPQPTESSEPTPEPTAEPTIEPTLLPTLEPAMEPTLEPTPEPTQEPTVEPTPKPSPELSPKARDFKVALDAGPGDYDYDVNTDGVSITITGYHGAGGDITIPEMIDGYVVTDIGASAFNYHSDILSIAIPEGVTSIGSGAFKYCENMVSISIPSNLKEVKSEAFHSCKKLVSIQLPDGVTSIGAAAFFKCYALESVRLPNDINIISEDIFNQCQSLISITIPEGVTNISFNAFQGCTSLSHVTLPNTVSTISNYAFCCCTSLKSITLPDSLNYIGVLAFANSGLTTIVIPNGVEEINDSAFFSCISLTDVTLPDSLTIVGINVFQSCTALKNINIPRNLSYISDDMFFECTSLESISIPSSVKRIGVSAFSHCTSLNTVFIPDGLKIINSNAFSGCVALTNIYLPDSIEEIGDHVFTQCFELEDVHLPQNITEISSHMFYWCTSLSNIDIPASVRIINDEAFKGCSAISSITLPDALETIGASSFSDCSSLICVSIPGNVNSVGYYAFLNCTDLLSAYFEGNAPDVFYSSVFNGCATGFTVYFLTGCTGFADTWYGYPTVVYGTQSTCNVNFNLNGAPGEQPANQVVYKWGKLSRPYDPVYSGYTFNGWYTERSGGFLWDFLSNEVRIDMSLYANWTCGVIYDSNGADAGTLPDDTNVYYHGDFATVIGNGNLMRHGYDFAGWNTEADGGGTSYVESDTLRLNEGNVTLFAQWTPHVYTITYKLNSGTVTVPNLESYTIESEDILLTNPTKKGWYFNGWSGTDLTEISNEVKIATGSTGDRVYVANWLPVHYQNSEFLYNIDITNGRLSPSFHPNSYDYLLAPDIGYTSCTVTVTPDDPGAVVTINGSHNKTITLSLEQGGARRAVILVVSPDGLRSKSYTIDMVQRSSNANLSNITGDTLSPNFNPNTLNYTVSPILIASTYCSFHVDVADPFASVTINGNKSTGIRLSTDGITYPKAALVEVTAADGLTKKTYKITSVNNNAVADLSSLYIQYDHGILSPSFNSNVTSYNIKPSYSVGSFTLIFSPADKRSTIKVNGTNLNDYAGSGQFRYSIGSLVNQSTKANIEVTAGDGVTKKIYTVSLLNVIPSTYLSGVNLSAGSLSPSFSKTKTSYTINLAENQGSVTLTPVKEYDGASMTIAGKSRSSYTVNVANGKNVNVYVKVKYGRTTKTYKFTVTRAKSTNNNLGSLKATNGTFDSAFNPADTSYTLTLDENVKSTKITASAAAGKLAKVSPSSQTITLKNGSYKNVKIKVKSQAGKYKTYTIKVVRKPSTNNNLSYLKTSSKSMPLSPSFSAAATSYTITLPVDKRSVTISAKAAGYKSTVYINGKKASSKKITLKAGASTTVRVVVRAQSKAEKVYTITVNRLISADTNLKSLKISSKGAPLSPAFSPNTLSYNVTLSAKSKSVALYAKANGYGAKVKIDGKSASSKKVSLKNGESKTVRIVVTSQAGTKKEYVITVTRPLA